MDPSLTPELVLQAYRAGAFPMADPDGELLWFSPDPRCILPFDRFHIPRSVRQIVRRRTFEIRINTAFEAVIHACADRPEGTWISAQIIEVYCTLHRQGFAHSVESWHEGRLAGGLYGIAISGAFFGESMFTHVSNASKAALVALVGRLGKRGYILLDTQWSTPHLVQFGAIEIRRQEYLRRLRLALALPCRFTSD